MSDKDFSPEDVGWAMAQEIVGHVSIAPRRGLDLPGYYTDTNTALQQAIREIIAGYDQAFSYFNIPALSTYVFGVESEADSAAGNRPEKSEAFRRIGHAAACHDITALEEAIRDAPVDQETKAMLGGRGGFAETLNASTNQIFYDMAELTWGKQPSLAIACLARVSAPAPFEPNSRRYRENAPVTLSDLGMELIADSNVTYDSVGAIEQPDIESLGLGGYVKVIDGEFKLTDPCALPLLMIGMRLINESLYRNKQSKSN